MNSLSASHFSNHTQSTSQSLRFQSSNVPSTNVGKSPYIKTTYAQPLTKIQGIPPSTSNTTTYKRFP